MNLFLVNWRSIELNFVRFSKITNSKVFDQIGEKPFQEDWFQPKISKLLQLDKD